MTAATTGRHARPEAQIQRRNWFGWPWRGPRHSASEPAPAERDTVKAAPRGEHPYPAIASLGAANEILRTAPFKREFAGASGTGQPLTALPFHPESGDLDHIIGPRLPDSTDMLAAILDGAKPEQVKVLEQVRDGLRNLDKPEPQAWLRQAITGGMEWQLTGNPEYLGLEPAGDDGGQMAEVGLGIGPGFPAALRGNREYLDTLLMVIAQARDALVDSDRVTPLRDTEVVTAEAAQPAPDVIGHARTVLARAEAVSLPEDERAANAISEAIASLAHAISLYECVRSGDIYPEAVDAAFGSGDIDAALEALAQDVSQYQSAVVVAIAVYQSGQPVAPVRDDGGDTADEAPEGNVA